MAINGFVPVPVSDSVVQKNFNDLQMIISVLINKITALETELATLKAKP